MNIQDLKAQIAAENGISLPHLVLVQQFEEDGKTPAPWVSHWDNTKRIRVTMHQDVFNQIKADPAKAGLALKKEVVPASADRAEYTRYVVITPQNIVGTF